MCSFYEGQIIGHFYANPARGAAVIVDFQDDMPKSPIPSGRFLAEGVFSGIGGRFPGNGCDFVPMFREVASDQSLAQLVTGVSVSQKCAPEAIVKLGVDLPQGRYRRCPRGVAGLVKRPFSRLWHKLPKAVSSQVVKWVFNGRLVIVLANRLKLASEGLHQFWAKRNFISGQDAAIEQFEDGNQKDRLVRPLMRPTLVTAEVVKPFQPMLPCLFRSHWITSRRTYASPERSLPH